MIKTRIILLILFVQIIPLKSQTHITTDFKDYIFEIHNIKNIKNLDIRAQHADIHLLNWDKDSISVETTLEILSDKPNLSKEMLDEIQIKTVTYANTLQVKTNLSKDFNRTIPYKITYNIFFPKKLSLKIENSHGLVNIPEVKGGVNANISYCDVNINNIESSADSIVNNLSLSYCKGSITHMGSAELNMNNSEIKTTRAKSINSHTAYSIFSFEQLNSFKGTSNIDNITLGNLQKISLKAENSVVFLQSFADSAFFELDKGQLTLLNSGDRFNELIVNNKNTQTSLHLNQSASYTIHGEITKGKLIHPQSKQLRIIKEEFKISFSGSIGSDLNTNSKVIVFNKNKNIEFK